MNTKVSLISLISILFLAACGTDSVQNRTQVVSSTVVAETVEPVTETAQTAVTAESPSCAQPTPEMVAGCEAEAAQILASTVRITIRQWIVDENGNRVDYLDGGTGHATVMDGRYLITHNHFSIPLLQLQAGADGQKVEVTVVRADNNMQVLENIPLTSVTVIPNGPESLILDMHAYGEMGLLEMMGVPSAQIGTIAQTNLQAGMVVAQINWDGHNSFVEWVPVEEITTVNNTAALRLANGLVVGASGGGVFHNGLHVANNWSSTSTTDTETGAVIAEYSTAALNGQTNITAAGS